MVGSTIVSRCSWGPPAYVLPLRPQVLKRDPASLQPHFGTAAAQSMLQDAMAAVGFGGGGGSGLHLPQLPSSVRLSGLPDGAAELPRRLAQQLGGSGGGSGGPPRLPTVGGAIESLGGAVQSASRGAAALASSIEASLARNVDVRLPPLMISLS